MSSPELRQIELLASIDHLRDRVQRWMAEIPDWAPAEKCSALLRRSLDRVETLRIRLEAPLVVATFGGTGTGKSSLVNAIVGEECTRSGRQRPTTRRPVIIAHPRTDLRSLGLPLDKVDVVEREAAILRDIVILDCPDPDTNESETSGSNLQQLHALLPYCDVLLYVSTQQKYRSARVSDELTLAAPGCRIVFVQTHADLDEDVREDWRRTLGGEYEVPDLYFVDSVRAMQEQRAGQKMSGDMGRLIDLLTTQLGASERVRIRRANVVDLLQGALARCREILHAERSKVAALTDTLAEQRQRMSERMVTQLRSELLASRNLWERRLVAAVTDTWGLSPFSSMLRLHHGLGSLIASMTLFRARSSAQLAILGAVQGYRWLEEKRQESAAEASVQRLASFGLDDHLLREAEIVIGGHVQSAGLPRELASGQSLDELRREAAVVEEEFVSGVGRRIDEMIRDLARQNSNFSSRVIYECLFSAYLAFVLYRVGKNFFYDSFLNNAALLTSDFYIAAGLFLVLWAGLLVMSFTRGLRRGLDQRIDQLIGETVQTRLSRGLFPRLEITCRACSQSSEELEALVVQATSLRTEIAGTSALGSRVKTTPTALPTRV